MPHLTFLKAMSTEIRPLVAADLSAVLTVEQTCHPFPWSEAILNDCLKAGYPGWVICENGKIVGYGMISLAVGECHILNICVMPQFRRKGYARQLMTTILVYAKQQGAEIAFLEVRVSNTAALNLYRQLGFNEIGVRKDYYPAANGKREDGIMFGYQF